METNKIWLRVSRIVPQTRDSVQLFFEAENGEPLSYEAGQFLTLIFPDLGPTVIRRSYSISAAPAAGEPLSICVKRTVNGSVSAYLTRKLQAGDRLLSLPPAGQFLLPDEAAVGKALVFIGGGSGITPLFSMIKEALLRQPQRSILLILANHSEDDIIFREGLKAWQRRFPNRFRIIHWLSAPNRRVGLGSVEGLDAVVRPGRLSNIALEAMLEQELGAALASSHAFLCGPPGLMLKAEMTLRFLGVSGNRLHKEDFVIHEPFRPEPEHLPDSQVWVRKAGWEQHFPLQAGQSVLEAAEQAGVELPYSCRSGTCTTCSAQLQSGRVEMYTGNSRVDSDATQGHIFTCVAYPLTEEVKFEIT